jgi:membrane protein
MRRRRIVTAAPSMVSVQPRGSGDGQPALHTRVYRRYREAHANRWATLIAWNGLFAFVPVLLVLVTILGLLLGQRSFATAVEARIASLGHTVSDQADIRSTLAAFRDRTGILAAVSFVGLLWTGSSLFSTLDSALSDIYGVRSRRFVRKRLMAVAMIFLFVLLIIPLLLSSVLLSQGHRFSVLPTDLPGAAIVVIQLATGALDGILLYLAIYHVVPNRKQRLRRVLPGALVAGILLELFTLLFPLYFEVTDSFSTYGVIFAVLVLLLTYFFFFGQITMLGALVNVELDPEARTQPPISI